MPHSDRRFHAAVHGAFAFLSEFGFAGAPFSRSEDANPFQVRFTNGKLTVVVEGNNKGEGVTASLEDQNGTTIPLILFVPSETGRPRQRRRRVDIDPVAEIQLEAQCLRDHCADLLQGDMTRFYNRVAEWRRIMNRDRSYQKRGPG